MKFTLTINNLEDAEAAARKCLELRDALRKFNTAAEALPLVSAAAVSEPVTLPIKRAKRKTRSDKGLKRSAAKKPTTATPPDKAPKKFATATPSDTVDQASARDKLHSRAIMNGVTWLRPILAQHGAARLGDLTDAQVDEVLASGV
jgi:hypothetical protein